MFSLNNLSSKPSAGIITATLVMLGSGLAVVSHTDMPVFLMIGMSVSGVFFATLFILQHGLLRLPKSIVRYDADEHSLYLTNNRGERITATPSASSFMTAHLLILSWKPDDNSAALYTSKWWPFTTTKVAILTSGNVSSKEDFRRFRVLLKFGKIAQKKTTTETSSS